jgi:hypothetical protein
MGKSSQYRTGPVHFCERAGRSGRRPKDGSDNSVPARVLAERLQRQLALAARDLTARICGDPPPGYSALDVKLRHAKKIA